mmetsp:Transcript_19689/g.43854  ORF Transcript_19689/g.43854 Transcript_19689/m.43854 type:complete len:265 (+) Transcript_19689:318-1112(+)
MSSIAARQVGYHPPRPLQLLPGLAARSPLCVQLGPQPRQGLLQPPRFEDLPAQCGSHGFFEHPHRPPEAGDLPRLARQSRLRRGSLGPLPPQLVLERRQLRLEVPRPGRVGPELVRRSLLDALQHAALHQNLGIGLLLDAHDPGLEGPVDLHLVLQLFHRGCVVGCLRRQIALQLRYSLDEVGLLPLGRRLLARTDLGLPPQGFPRLGEVLHLLLKTRYCLTVKPPHALLEATLVFFRLEFCLEPNVRRFEFVTLARDGHELCF